MSKCRPTAICYIVLATHSYFSALESGCALSRRASFAVLDKRIIKGRPFGVGFDRSHLNLQQGAPS